MRYNIILEFVPINTPQYKGYIEQWFNVLRNAIQREPVPGYRPALKHRLENRRLDPERDAAFTLIEIESWLHKWIIDEYQFSNSYDDHVQAPFLRLQNCIDGKTRLIFPKPREHPIEKWERDTLYLSQLAHMKRSLRKDGITWEYLRYHSKELSEIHKILGDCKIDVKQNKRDVRFIWVQHLAKKQWIRVGLGAGWGATLLAIHGDKPVQESAWIEYTRIVQSVTKEKLNPFLVKSIISKQLRRDLIELSKKSTRTARKEAEKQKEAIRKDVSLKVNNTTEGTESSSLDKESRKVKIQNDITIDKRPRKKIDFSNVALLPTDKFHGER